MKKQWNILRSFAGNNRGSGIVVVLVSMACVALMGASMLFMSYTAMRLRATERQASKDFYSAETAVDEIRAGVQSVVSEAIATSYKYVLETYTDGAQINDRFADRFLLDLKKAGLFTNSGTKYDVDTLKSYVSDPAGVTVESVSGGLIVENAVEDIFVLKDIKVTYTADNGYITEISTDISIGMPEFAYIMSATSISGLPQHALIAKNSLEQTEGTSTIEINGSAYAGKLQLEGNAGSKMTISKGTLVCAEDAVVDGSTTNGRLVTEQQVKFWAGRVVVEGGSSVDLGGETRVLDDLELAGGQSKAVLSGSYYGFGDGTSDDGSKTGQANRSSAILVNGLNSELRVSDLNRLMLAGRSYISKYFYSGQTYTETDTTPSVGMMESISVRSNQQMYLIDPIYLDGVSQNPEVTAGSATGTLNAAGQQLAAEHGFSLAQRQYSFPGGQKINYYFMEFNDPISANAYFEEYFAKNSGQISSYLGTTSNLNAAGTSTLGYTIRGNDGVYTVSRPNGVTFDCAGMRSTFNQLKKTLIDSNTMATATNPYDYIINREKMDALSGTREFTLTEDGATKTVGVVTRGAYVIDGSSEQSDLRLVIAEGDVTVSANYEGLVICGGTIHIRNNLTMTANESDVLKAFNATGLDETDTLGSYLAHGGSESMGDAVDPGDVDGWNLDTLVTYKNWTKN